MVAVLTLSHAQMGLSEDEISGNSDFQVRHSITVPPEIDYRLKNGKNVNQF